MDKGQLYELLNYKIIAKTKNNQEHIGYLVCVDPISLTIILYNNERQPNTMMMITNHSIKSIQKLDSESICPIDNFQHLCDTFFEIQQQKIVSKIEFTDDELKQRRINMLQLMKANNVPVEEQDDALIVAYSVCINPPYMESDCLSNNPVVLERIRDIIRKG
ncbi:hypothetical protein RDWZM_008422 [Blomia tropicalis]|uniref:AD domain-containing protein n=1 Tax=Blomia tropicalis TaxID=40697 RepID=A0A9Q0M4F5_BLOTA|nr:Gem (Nuclear organelle) associated protein 6 [Blomia tropicalis]KAJ6217265.1 hypothetical protein RDWZM_008422 [Blomia tropicalis]